MILILTEGTFKDKNMQMQYQTQFIYLHTQNYLTFSKVKYNLLFNISLF